MAAGSQRAGLMPSGYTLSRSARAVPARAALARLDGDVMAAARAHARGRTGEDPGDHADHHGACEEEEIDRDGVHFWLDSCVLPTLGSVTVHSYLPMGR